jgi:hypothetical protein
MFPQYGKAMISNLAFKTGSSKIVLTLCFHHTFAGSSGGPEMRLSSMTKSHPSTTSLLSFWQRPHLIASLKNQSLRIDLLFKFQWIGW